MKKLFAVTAAIVLLSMGLAAQANITIETVPVGDVGNNGELAGASVQGGAGVDRICGSVGYNYNIGKYEVTAGQYTAFLNAKASVSDPHGLYSSDMWSSSTGCKIQQDGTPGSYSYSVAGGYANRPVNFVSFWDSCRFANWLANGQGNGSTETGAYTLTADGITNNTITRNAGATWAVTSEDEWYKAAYYKGGGPNAGYWRYPTQNDSINAGMVNYAGSVGHTTDVGSYAHPSPYGTFDQGGNVWEWNEAIVSSVNRGLRGGAFNTGDPSPRAAIRGRIFEPTYEVENIGSVSPQFLSRHRSSDWLGDWWDSWA